VGDGLADHGEENPEARSCYAFLDRQVNKAERPTPEPFVQDTQLLGDTLEFLGLRM